MDKNLGIYIHIPFCAGKCYYCDFCSVSRGEKTMPKYQEALTKHLTESSEQMSDFIVDSIYFGGGTPSYYGGKRICELFNTIKNSARVLKHSEVTVECNPDSMNKQDLVLMRKEGVNRLSIGMQSANTDLLKLIGRRHSFKQVENAVSMARSEGFDNISLDLIYGLPSQTRKDWADTLIRALELNPEHISCYGLKLSEGTKMYRDYNGSPLLPSDDEQADMYLFTVDTLAQYGYPQYEISNFALEGYESRHNLKYWNLDDYMGFGASAHSNIGGVRYSYTSSISRYINGILKDESILDEYEEISRIEKASEYIMLGMRTREGISKDEYVDIYMSDFDAIEHIFKGFGEKGWAFERDGRWIFTSSGYLLSNVLINILLEAQAKNKVVSTPWVSRDDSLFSAEDVVLPSGGSKFYISDFS